MDWISGRICTHAARRALTSISAIRPASSRLAEVIKTTIASEELSLIPPRLQVPFSLFFGRGPGRGPCLRQASHSPLTPPNGTGKHQPHFIQFVLIHPGYRPPPAGHRE